MRAEWRTACCVGFKIQKYDFFQFEFCGKNATCVDFTTKSEIVFEEELTMPFSSDILILSFKKQIKVFFSV